MWHFTRETIPSTTGVRVARVIGGAYIMLIGQANVRDGRSPRHRTTAVLLLLLQFSLITRRLVDRYRFLPHRRAEASVPVRARRRSTGIINGDASGSQTAVIPVRAEPRYNVIYR